MKYIFLSLAVVTMIMDKITEGGLENDGVLLALYWIGGTLCWKLDHMYEYLFSKVDRIENTVYRIEGDKDLKLSSQQPIK